MTVRDYNGQDEWSAEALMRRYRQLVLELGVTVPRDLSPSTHQSGTDIWIYPVMDKVIPGIEAGDPACAQIGVEFVEQDQGFVFGAILKSNTARALRRFRGLTEAQVERLRHRIVALYETGVVPREFRQYLRLLRRIGVGPHGPRLAAAAPKNRFAKRAQAYLSNHLGIGR